MISYRLYDILKTWRFIVDKHDDNPELLQPVQKENELKEWFVNYVGEKLQPKNEEVTMEMVIEVLSVDFPEILLVVAEENFIRGYQQAMYDVDTLDVDDVVKTNKKLKAAGKKKKTKGKK